MHLKTIKLILQELSVQARMFVLSPGQLLFRADAAGFWHVRVRDCVPVPHDAEQAFQTVQEVHPMAPIEENMVSNDLKEHQRYFHVKNKCEHHAIKARQSRY